MKGARVVKTSSEAQPALDGAGRGKLTHEIILREAAALFKRQGYRKTSLEDLARLLGVTRPAFYYYFKSKTDILSAIQIRAIDGLTNLMELEGADHLSPRDRFWAHIEAHIAYVAANAIEVGIVFEEEEELPPSVADHINRQRRAYTHWLIDLYSDGLRPRQTRKQTDARLAVNTILGAATWVYRWYRPEMGTPLRFAKEVVRVLRAGEPTG